MRAAIVGLTLLSLALASCDPSQLLGRIELDRIATRYQNGEVEKAQAELEAFVVDRPDNSLAWTILGHVRQDRDLDDAARQAYLRALEIDPRRIEAMTGLGVLERRAGNYDAAMGWYSKALAVDPSYAQAHSSMTIICLKRLRDEDALRHAARAYELDGSDPVIAANLAVAYHYNDMPNDRDRLAKIATELGYRTPDRLQQIFTDELSVRD